MSNQASVAKIISEMNKAASHFNQHAEAGKPHLDIFGAPAKQQLSASIRPMRSGDCLLQIARNLPGDIALAEASACLDSSMRNYAALALHLDRPTQLTSQSMALRCLNDVVGYTVETIHTEAIIAKVFDMNSTMSRMWQPLADATRLLVEADRVDLVQHLAERMVGVEDDNDLACIFSGVEQRLFDEYIDTNDEAKAELSYKMLQCDWAVMGSNSAMTQGEYVAYEIERRLQHQESRPASAHKLG